jgi:ABC-type branched-subunit amino acid transport system substrate-binding protein
MVSALALFSACNVDRPVPDVGVNTPKYPDSDTIKIGVLTVLTGDLATDGEAELNAALLAATQVNALGGVLGRQIEIVAKDYQGDPDKAAMLATSLITDDKVVGILGASGSGASIAAQMAIQAFKPQGSGDMDHRVPQISCCSTSKLLTYGPDTMHPDTNWDGGYFFRAAPSDVLQAQVVAGIVAGTVPAATSLGFDIPVDMSSDSPTAGKKVGAVVYIDNAYGDGFQGDLKKDFDTTKVAVADGAYISYPDGAQTSDLVTSATNLYNALSGLSVSIENTFVVLVAYDDTGSQFVNQFMTLTQGKSPYWIPTDGAQSTLFVSTITQGRNDAVFAKMLGTAPGADPASGKAYTFFDSTYRATFNSAPAGFAAENYDAAMVMMLAIQYAQSTYGPDLIKALPTVSRLGANGDRHNSFDPTALGQAFLAVDMKTDIDYQGVSGPMDFDDNGDVTAASYALWQVMNGQIVAPKFVSQSTAIAN